MPCQSKPVWDCLIPDSLIQLLVTAVCAEAAWKRVLEMAATCSYLQDVEKFAAEKAAQTKVAFEFAAEAAGLDPTKKENLWKCAMYVHADPKLGGHQ
tara:strand:- start:53 stop:343 length:291 start_codon:yes stop_codon:yes gene_type:complete